MKDENIESLTCSSALLAGISNDILQEIRQRTSVKQYEKGATIAREGVECKSLGFLRFLCCQKRKFLVRTFYTVLAIHINTL